MNMTFAMVRTNLTQIRQGFDISGNRDRIDEMCTCGHYRSLHSHHISPGYGSCFVCKCQQFTFESYLVKQTGPRNVTIEVSDELNGAVANVTECPDDVCVDVIYRRED